MPTPSELARAHVPALYAYTPGLQPTDSGWVKLNTNECPYEPSPRVVAAIQEELTHGGARLRLYPSPTSAPLRAKIAEVHGVTPEQVIVGNGSDDILNLLVRVFGDDRQSTGFTFPSYSLYPVLVAIQDGGTEVIEFDRSMRLPVDRIAQSGARAFFLTSPNAPTGVGFTNAELRAVLNTFPGVLVVDEAYAPFAEENAVPLLAEYRNLVVVRTLSKAHALAGMRVGYALADPETIGLLDRVRDSYNVNRLSQVAALAALSDASYYDAIIGKIKRTRDHWAGEWAQRDWFIYQSATNFLFVEPRNAAGESGPAVAESLFKFFQSRKILVRAFPSHALTASFLRISVGTDDEMLAVDEAIQAWLTNAP
ncbi:histidinol-phosphate transaminase [Actomonas aquatica]|uniref:Histidinol-phosphate aminotransferase n=1 Tax=Actomonas aquatica TaxID=2866162 RepID=A0ABZ1CDK4_9BACT|nr:histidinol-phosphate transaminase [Opitutus sp. WL0086]WRQ89644.1 histidinol-phosphate transaminase [Opitutus sp. WL0086]